MTRRNCQPQPTSAVFVTGRRLLKRIENHRLIGHRNTGPGIGNLKSMRTIGKHPSREDDSTGLGKFDGITEKIGKNLPELRLVTPDQTIRQIAPGPEAEPFFCARMRENSSQFIENAMWAENAFVKFFAPGLNLGKIENVIDHGKKMPAAHPDRVNCRLMFWLDGLIRFQ